MTFFIIDDRNWMQCVNSTSTSDTASRLQTSTTENNSWVELSSVWIQPPRQTPPPGYRQAQQKPTAELSWAVREFHLHVRHRLQATDKHNRNQQLSWVEQGLTSHSTQSRSFWRRLFLQVWWPNQQCQSTEGWLVIQTGLSLTMLTSPCTHNTGK